MRCTPVELAYRRNVDGSFPRRPGTGSEAVRRVPSLRQRGHRGRAHARWRVPVSLVREACDRAHMRRIGGAVKLLLFTVPGAPVPYQRPGQPQSAPRLRTRRPAK